MSKIIELSNLPKTWILDLDGTIVAHNGHLKEEKLLDGVYEFFQNLGKDDKVLIITAREEIYKEETVKFLKKHNIKYDNILFNYPTGERILVNDKKPSGLKTAYAINKGRDQKLDISFKINNQL